MTHLVPPVGSEAPDFLLRSQHGEQIVLSDFRDQRNVLLVFFPFAFTGVCTGELGALGDRIGRFEEADTEVLAISCDTMYTLRAYAESERLYFTLLSDFWPHGGVASSYGVFDADRGCAVRGTFAIDRSGIIRWSVVNAIPDARRVVDYEAALAHLG
jgi:peroxiredoxin